MRLPLTGEHSKLISILHELEMIQTEKKKSTSKTVPELTKSKTIVFRFLLIITPLLFFVILEGILRLTGYGLETDPLVVSKVNPDYLEIQKDLGKKYFPREKLSPIVAADKLLVKKPKNGFRIFVFGGSTAAGYPYMYNGSFSTMLRVLLQKSYPEIHFEVLNFAMTAVNSFTVVDLLNRTWKYSPDLILIYTGHNEFYGALGVGSVESLGHSRGIIKAYLYLSNHKTFQLVQNSINWFIRLLQTNHTKQDNSQGTLMERIVKKKQIRYRDSLYKVALKNFQENITEVMHESKQQGVPLIISTISSNILDQEPFTNEFLSRSDSLLWQKNYDQGINLLNQNKFDSAAYYFQRCIDIDSLIASSNYMLGQIFYQKSEFDKSYKYLYRAKDFDALRFRASEDINKIIRQSARAKNVPLVDIKAQFENASPHRIPGRNLFLEHLHPNLDGYTLIAKSFYQYILNNHFIKESATQLDLDKIDWKNLGVTDFDLEAGRLRISVLTSGWPFKKDKIGSLENINYVPVNFLQGLVLQYWKNDITWEKAHVELAEYYSKTGQPDLAEEEYKALIIATPSNPSPYRRLGQILIQQKKYDEAFYYLHALLKFSNDIFAYKLLGSMFVEKGEIKRGILYLQEAMKLNQNDEQNLYLLASAYQKAGDRENSRKILAYLLTLNPNYPGVSIGKPEGEGGNSSN